MSQQPAHSVLFDQQGFYQYGDAAPGNDNMEFYQTTYADPSSYSAGNPSYYPSDTGNYQANRIPTGGFWSAFGTGGFPDEPPLLEELGFNFTQIKDKTVVALNPFKTVDRNIMADPDLAGPLLFCFAFGIFLLLAGKVQFGYVYGLAVVGCIGIYLILNLMSESGIDGYRTASVLGYCLLPMVLLSCFRLILPLSGLLGLLLSVFTICWCTFSSSLMFVTVLSMNQQRWLVAYPVGLLYAAFALITVF
ncbi:Yip1-domain-containing protein [Basidiobolus meristosporus CBS 931.73]|uniref:Protein YIP n=1 Tax=Basidiobolus meristosporus CBS 931.73 TaxID=1314790 RepID=A0A1Y1XSY4_9FUNG|nr:Yip1-domain-containing protein [Basidiobolus meristosporus CBS 931.73]|eukprot:ORX88414.1 Yip1-domain-containing protein [Basidiobolus meristosporus CBS 931.73]